MNNKICQNKEACTFVKIKLSVHALEHVRGVDDRFSMQIHLVS